MRYPLKLTPAPVRAGDARVGVSLNRTRFAEGSTCVPKVDSWAIELTRTDLSVETGFPTVEINLTPLGSNLCGLCVDWEHDLFNLVAGVTTPMPTVSILSPCDSAHVLVVADDPTFFRRWWLELRPFVHVDGVGKILLPEIAPIPLFVEGDCLPTFGSWSFPSGQLYDTDTISDLPFALTGGNACGGLGFQITPNADDGSELLSQSSIPVTILWDPLAGNWVFHVDGALNELTGTGFTVQAKYGDDDFGDPFTFTCSA